MLARGGEQMGFGVEGTVVEGLAVILFRKEAEFYRRRWRLAHIYFVHSLIYRMR